jgi:hypothetical protein
MRRAATRYGAVKCVKRDALFDRMPKWWGAFFAMRGNCEFVT